MCYECYDESNRFNKHKNKKFSNPKQKVKKYSKEKFKESAREIKVEFIQMDEAKKKVDEINYEHGVDLLLIMDCTGSMTNWIS